MGVVSEEHRNMNTLIFKENYFNFISDFSKIKYIFFSHEKVIKVLQDFKLISL